ncbi:hypothetical protein ACAH01_16130 (plasmid) [Halomicrobium sp. HM KBTZ05]|uniref:DUF5789 family protein n=1 Tax=Halomicrobium sp. HM KBTZ05 TaxID=3242663 RepID=UPI00355771E0
MANDQSSSDSDAATDSREMGVDFGQLTDELRGMEYPVTREAVLAEYGDADIELSGGTETLQSILGDQETETDGAERHEYDSADAVRQAVLTMVGSEAVGREDYSDRGGSAESAGGDIDGDGDEDQSL